MRIKQEFGFAVFIFILLLIVKVFFISSTYLVDDEAYYAMYARHLAWGYIDHGPVVAFVIWLFTITNESGFTVRLGPVVLLSLLPIILYIVINKYLNRQFALIASLTLIANLMFYTNSIIITPDVPLAFFSILSILFYYIAFFKDDRFMYLGGVMLGLSVLSKVSALFPAFGIFLLRHERVPRCRETLFSVQKRCPASNIDQFSFNMVLYPSHATSTKVTTVAASVDSRG